MNTKEAEAFAEMQLVLIEKGHIEELKKILEKMANRKED